jgi:hypothetical protein
LELLLRDRRRLVALEDHLRDVGQRRIEPVQMVGVDTVVPGRRRVPAAGRPEIERLAAAAQAADDERPLHVYVGVPGQRLLGPTRRTAQEIVALV